MTPFEILLASPRSLADVLVDSLRRRNARAVSGGEATPAGDDGGQRSLALFAEAGTTRQPHPLRPAEAAAAVLLGRALDADRAAAADLVNDEAVTVIEVPSPDLVELVKDLLVHHLIGSGRALEGDGSPGDWPVAPGSVTVFSRDGSNEKRTRKWGNDNFAAAVQRGCAVVGISADPFRQLPSELTTFATQRIILPRLDSDSVAAIIEAVTGKRPAGAITAAAVHGGLRLLSLAVRADLGSARSLDRLERLAEIGSEPDGTPLLSQLHGLGEAQKWGLSLVEDLRDMREGRVSAAELPRGIVLWGKPGTGKTLFARSLSKEAGVFFRATSYGEWQSHRDGHLGSVIQAIRKVFAEVAANAPGILFIDEIDSLPARGSTNRHDDWWTAITNVLLEELDSVDPRRRQGTIVLAACNNLLRLDPALTRAGRLDKVVHIPLPDAAALAGIMETHLGEHLGAGELLPAAAEARGSTGADVERWARGVRRRARKADRAPTIDDLLSEIRSGRPVRTDAQRRRMAYHESGHAIVALGLDGDCPVALSIVDADGGFASFDTAQLSLLTRPRFDNLIARILGGRAAEELACGGISDGGAEDIALATKLAVSVECTLGLGNLGPLSLGENPPITAVLAIPEAAASVRKLLSDGHRRAVQVLRKNRELLDRLATELLAHGFLEGAEIGRIVSPAARTQENVGEDMDVTAPSDPSP